MTVTVESYNALVADRARPQPRQREDIDHVAYAALGLAGEAGEVGELVKKSMRTDGSLDRVKLALEPGDPIWYAVRLAHLHDMTFEDVLAVNMAKLERRALFGKDEPAEREMTERILHSRARSRVLLGELNVIETFIGTCRWCRSEDGIPGHNGYCSAYCAEEARSR